MSVIAGTIITGSTLVKLVVAALVAGLGVTIAFSVLIYCAERAVSLRRDGQRGASRAFQAASLLALTTVLALVVYGLILTTSKPK